MVMRWILTSVLMVVFFATPISAQELTGTLQQIKKSGIIKIGYRESQPPMSFMEKDKPVGYSIDLCGQIVSEVETVIGGDVTIKYIPVTSEERFVALSDNRIDILCGATTKTISRGEIVDFTLITFVTGASFMTLEGANIRNRFDGKKIGVTKATTTIEALEKILEEAQTKAEVVPMDSSTGALKALENSEIDAFAADQVVLIGLALTSGNPEKYDILPDLFSYEPFALAVRRNDADFRLVADRVISDLYRSRKILKIYDKWIGQFSSSRSSAFKALTLINSIPE
jgi:ABC-type amino acid transport substrate-binding protein